MRLLLLFCTFPIVFLIANSNAADNPVITVDGKFVGANCMFFLKECPDDMAEGHIAAEPDFVLLKPDGKYFYILNVDRAIKARYFHKNVRVKGSLGSNGSIIATSIEKISDGKYQEIWSLKKEQEERSKFEFARQGGNRK